MSADDDDEIRVGLNGAVAKEATGRESEGRTRESPFLYFAAFVANLLGFAAGTAASWTSPVFPKLDDPDGPLNVPIGTLQKSLVAAALCVGQTVGPFVFGDLSESIGRKKTLILIAVPMSLGLATLAFATDVRLYYLGRFLHGLGVGGCFTVLTTYTAEIAEQQNRGKFSCISTIFLSLGILYPYLVGNVLDVRSFSLSCLAPLLAFFALFPAFAPDSPLYLVKVDETDVAENALIRLRGGNVAYARRELAQTREFVDANRQRRRGYLEVFRSATLRRPLGIGVGLVVFQQFSGTGVVVAFMNDILLEAGNVIPAEYGTSIVASMKVLVIFVTSTVIERLGRRILLLASAAGCATANACLGLYLSLKTSDPIAVERLSWLPLICLAVYVVSFNLGIGSVVWVVVSEIFPSGVRATASAVVTACCFASTTLIVFVFPIVTERLGMAASFWIFGCCCVTSFAFIYNAVPETKGKSFAEIQKILSR
ncbi:facilitated trehalose transporter Tret1-2 homolog [Cylas formicarius]|uniref:facilitated trehalose transporter Tret1-2 homolog n=1 Tax=Cylas formicarius TaxID=197179 RepID=UPI002958BF5D|nr:facilitated trehalose transporter Tret1-2 homolog [Cylas formicarius]